MAVRRLYTSPREPHSSRSVASGSRLPVVLSPWIAITAQNHTHARCWRELFGLRQGASVPGVGPRSTMLNRSADSLRGDPTGASLNCDTRAVAGTALRQRGVPKSNIADSYPELSTAWLPNRQPESEGGSDRRRRVPAGALLAESESGLSSRVQLIVANRVRSDW